ncbi:uncharacterized protein EI90DRAFT_3022091 [Cantharellus anzutake]|uniref:uncharacterized protein n=1 Tax=Cantharellus anzutake TaxID=1750568 RepID=UPI0019059061|nr:uncharacterized protein EI90DRAFT_3022091 [Cantharellus anzutake]KAF8315072.1 hypothetical protein EI90DRAFT_3022091 [Cantharellus anzutake]
MCASLPVTDNFLHPDILDGCDRNPHRDQAEGEQCHPFAPGNVLRFRDISYGGPSNHGRIAPSFRAHTTLGLVRWWPLDEDHFNHLLGYSVKEIKTLLSATLYTATSLYRSPPVLEPEHELPANLHVKLKKHHIKHLRTAYSVEDHHYVPQLVQGTTSIIYTKSLHQIIQYFYSNILQTIPVPQTPSSDVFYHIVCDPDNPINHPGMEYFVEPDLHKSGFIGAHLQRCNPSEFHVAFQLTFPPPDLQWEPPRMQGKYNQDRRQGGHIQFKDGGKGWKRHPFHVSWWEFIIKFDCTGANPWSSDTFPADRAGTRLPVLILNPLVDDKAMWDGNLIRREVWKSPILQDEGTED